MGSFLNRGADLIHPELDIEDAFDFVFSEDPDDSTRSFVSSLKSWYDEHKKLTPKQHNALVGVLERMEYSFGDASVAQVEERPAHTRETVGASPTAGPSTDSFDKYQKDVREADDYPAKGRNFVLPVLWLSVRTGDLSARIAGIVWQKNGSVDTADREGAKEELSDVLGCILQLASEFEMPFSEIAAKNLQRTTDRKEGRL